MKDFNESVDGLTNQVRFFLTKASEENEDALEKPGSFFNQLVQIFSILLESIEYKVIENLEQIKQILSQVEPVTDFLRKNHFDRETSNYLGLGAGGTYFGLGLYACWYSYQMQKKALAEEARTLLEVDDEEQIQISVSESKMNVFTANPSSPVSDNKDNKNNIDLSNG